MRGEGAGVEAFSRTELLRYARHFALDEIGVEGQRRLSEASVLLVGAGGLGSPAALYLAAAGVGRLGVIDDDRVDLSNLQRQVLHGTSGVGRAKVESARDRILEMNPHVEVTVHGERLTVGNALERVGAYDIVLDGSDNFATRYLVNDACVLGGRPWVYGAILRWEGQLAVFGVPGGPCYRCLFREPPPPGLIPGCAEAGVVGALPGIIGSLQALEVIKWILGAGRSMAGRLLVFDALELSFREIALDRRADCPVCGDAPTIREVIDVEHFCATGRVRPASPPGARAGMASPGGAATGGMDRDSTDAVPEVSAREFLGMLQGKEHAPLLVDVREEWEWAARNLAHLGAVHIPLERLGSERAKLDPARPTVIYCATGARSAGAVRFLVSKGFKYVWNLRGGIEGWPDAFPEGREVDQGEPE